MAIFGFVVIVLLSIGALLSSLALYSLAATFGSRNGGDWFLIAVFAIVGCGGLYLAYQQMPFQIVFGLK